MFERFLRFSDFQNLSRFHHRKILWKRLEKPIVLDSKIDLPKMLIFHTKIPRPPNLVRKYRRFFKNVFDSWGSIFVSRVFMIFISPKYHQDSTTENYLKTLGDTNCFGPTRFTTPKKRKRKLKNNLHLWCSVVSKIVGILEFRNNEIWRNNICEGCFHIFLYFLKHFWW